MSKLSERQRTRESAKLLPDTYEDLPGLPDDVTIPADISGLVHPESTRLGPPAAGIRWLHWLPAALLVVAGAIALALILRSDGSDQPAYNFAEAGGPASAAYLPETSGVVYNYNPIVSSGVLAEAGGPASAAYLPETSGVVYNYNPIVSSGVLAEAGGPASAAYLPETSGVVYNYNPIVSSGVFAEAGGPASAAYLPETSGEVYNYNPIVSLG